MGRPANDRATRGAPGLAKPFGRWNVSPHNPMKNSLCLAALLSLAPVALAAGPDFHDHLGIQMWSLRETSKENTPAALDLVQKYDLKEIETAGFGTLSRELYIAALQARGLKVVGAHIGYEELQKDLPGAIATARALGTKYIVVPWIPHGKEGFTVAQAHQVAADFNTWGQAIRAAGLQLAWHPHGFEFAKSPSGETPFDVIVAETSSENLALEMDVFWVFHAGQDPAALLKKLGSRWALMHVKDIRKGAAIGDATGGAPASDNVAVGAGQIDWKSVLAAGQAVGVQHYILEDETTAPLTCIPESLRYLRALKL